MILIGYLRNVLNRSREGQVQYYICIYVIDLHLERDINLEGVVE